ncbi:MAG: hypothetical protein V4558_06025 [Gemmatimonadota bacterium]
MRFSTLAVVLACCLATTPLVAQTAAPAAATPAPLKLAAGTYLVAGRDSTRPIPPDITFVFHEDGSFEINVPAGEPILGMIQQKDGLLLWVEARCAETGSYFVRAEGKGFFLEAREDECAGRKEQLGLVRFMPAPKR